MQLCNVPALLRANLHLAGDAPYLESGLAFFENCAKKCPPSHHSACSFDSNSKPHREVFEDAWRECEQWHWKPGQTLPTPLMRHDVDELRNRGLYLPRKPAHDILMAARGFMNEELMQSADIGICAMPIVVQYVSTAFQLHKGSRSSSRNSQKQLRLSICEN